MTDRTGTVVRRQYRVEMSVVGNVVRSSRTFTSPNWDHPPVSQGTLRFAEADALAGFLSDAVLTIEEQFGDWDRQPLTDSSPEIITIERKR